MITISVLKWLTEDERGGIDSGLAGTFISAVVAIVAISVILEVINASTVGGTTAVVLSAVSILVVVLLLAILATAMMRESY